MPPILFLGIDRCSDWTDCNIWSYSNISSNVNVGVPHGSFQVPFLFIVYIDDIVNDINNDTQLFTDDTSLFVVVEDGHAAVAASLTEDMNVMSNVAKTWAVQFILKILQILYLVEGTRSTQYYNLYLMEMK